MRKIRLTIFLFFNTYHPNAMYVCMYVCMCIYILYTHTILLLLLGYVIVFFEELEYICGDTVFVTYVGHE